MKSRLFIHSYICWIEEKIDIRQRRRADVCVHMRAIAIFLFPYDTGTRPVRASSLWFRDRDGFVGKIEGMRESAHNSADATSIGKENV